MIKGHDIIKYTQTVSFFCFKEPVKPTFPIPFKSKQKFLFMTPVGDVPGESRYAASVRSRHT